MGSHNLMMRQVQTYIKLFKTAFTRRENCLMWLNLRCKVSEMQIKKRVFRFAFRSPCTIFVRKTIL